MNKRDVANGLQGKGFVEDKTRDHIYYTYRSLSGAITTIRTKVSHGSGKGIGSNLIGRMAKQCRLSIRGFRDLISCTLSREDYEQEIFSD